MAQVGKATYHNAARPFLPPSYLLLVSSLFLYHDVRLKADDNINGRRSVRRRGRARDARKAKSEADFSDESALEEAGFEADY